MAGESMAANMNGFGMYPNFMNNYANQIMLNDLYDNSLCPMNGISSDLMNTTGGMNMGINPMMSMNGSIFGGGDYPMTSMPMFGGGMGYSQEDYFKYMNKNQDYSIDYQINQRQKMRNADMKINSPEETVMVSANYLREKILDNEQEQIQPALKKYIENIKKLYGEASEEQLKSRAEILYQQQFGTSMIEDIRKHGNSSFTQGFLQPITLGIADKKTAEQNISEITGQPVGRSENSKKVAGNIVGGTVIGAGVAVSTNAILKGLKVGLKNKPFVAGLIGAGVGLLVALFTSSGNNNSNNNQKIGSV